MVTNNKGEPLVPTGLISRSSELADLIRATSSANLVIIEDPAQLEAAIRAHKLERLLLDGDGVEQKLFDPAELIAVGKRVDPKIAAIGVGMSSTKAAILEAMSRSGADTVVYVDGSSHLEHALLDRYEAIDIEFEKDGVHIHWNAAETDAFVGKSPVMNALFETIKTLAKKNGSVLITGETGVGKQLVAELLHALGPRSAHQLVSISAPSLPEDSKFESILFGHVKGAFSGADTNKLGALRQAHLGTIYLDEVGDIHPDGQVRLLVPFQEKMIRPLGSDTEYHSDFRIVCATNADLFEMVAKGLFRDDLLFRIKDFIIRVPTLRERGPEDIILLANHFLRMYAEQYPEIPLKRLDDSLIEPLTKYPWPGNVRQLKSLVMRMCAMTNPSTKTLLSVSDFDSAMKQEARQEPPKPLAEVRENAEAQEIEKALRYTNGNISEAARLLKVDRKQLYRDILKYDLKRASRLPKPSPKS